MQDEQNSMPTRSAISGDFGDAVLVLMKDPVFNTLPLHALQNVLLEPFDRGQLVIARGANKDNVSYPVALICIAHLSEALHNSMLTNPGNTELSGADWQSGDHTWFAIVSGPSDVVVPTVKKIAEERFPGSPVWFRAIDRHGKMQSAQISA